MAGTRKIRYCRAGAVKVQANTCWVIVSEARMLYCNVNMETLFFQEVPT